MKLFLCRFVPGSLVCRCRYTSNTISSGPSFLQTTSRSPPLLGLKLSSSFLWVTSTFHRPSPSHHLNLRLRHSFLVRRILKHSILIFEPKIHVVLRKIPKIRSLVSSDQYRIYKTDTVPVTLHPLFPPLLLRLIQRHKPILYYHRTLS